LFFDTISIKEFKVPGSWEIPKKVKSLYAEKTDSQQDSVITKKILWTAGRQLLINTISNVNNRILTTTERYNWSLNYSK
jgi:hypothetical protein